MNVKKSLVVIMCGFYSADPKCLTTCVRLPRLPPCHSLMLCMSSKDFGLSTGYHPQLGLQILFLFNDQQKFSQPYFLKAASEVNVGMLWELSSRGFKCLVHQQIIKEYDRNSLPFHWNTQYHHLPAHPQTPMFVSHRETSVRLCCD